MWNISLIRNWEPQFQVFFELFDRLTDIDAPFEAYVDDVVITEVVQPLEPNVWVLLSKPVEEQLQLFLD